MNDIAGTSSQHTATQCNLPVSAKPQKPPTNVTPHYYNCLRQLSTKEYCSPPQTTPTLVPLTTKKKTPGRRKVPTQNEWNNFNFNLTSTNSYNSKHLIFEQSSCQSQLEISIHPLARQVYLRYKELKCTCTSSTRGQSVGP